MSASFKSFSQVKMTQDEMIRFIIGNELKLTQVELLSLSFQTVCMFTKMFTSIFCGYIQMYPLSPLHDMAGKIKSQNI